MIRQTADAAPRRAARLALPLCAAFALGACAVPENPAGLVPASRAADGAVQTPYGVLVLTDAQRRAEIRAARKGQLQTPLRLPPQATGAPDPRERGRDEIVVGERDLLAAGVDIAPDVRVWNERNGFARLIYGPRPQNAADLALGRAVEVEGR
jgi:hypothetical protein